MKRRAHGEGTIYKRSNGRWAGQANVRLANGKPKRAFVTAKTREEVVVKLRKMLEQESKKIPYIDKDWTVEGYLDYWMKTIQKKRIRESTWYSYHLNIEKYIKPTMGGFMLKELNVHNVRDAMYDMERLGCNQKPLT